MTAITRRIVCIAGFTQGLSTPTGMETLWRRLRWLYHAHDCEITWHRWNDDWPGFAAHVLRTGPDDPRLLDVRIVAYSWGAGSGALRLMKLFRKMGVGVQVAVFLDPVYRSGWTLWRSMWSPLLGEPKIVIPPNVRELHYFRQRNNKPAGHEVVAARSAATEIHDHGFLDRTHEWLDDAIEGHDLAVRLMGA